MNLLGRISTIFRSALPPLDAYNLEPIPSAKPKIVVKASTVTGEVYAGKEWKTEWDKDGNSVSSKVGTNSPATANLVTLDGYDQAFLCDIIGRDWKRNESKAKSMKWHWLREESAKAIQEYHTSNGQLERGYSERTAADFIKAFFAADERREQDGKQRQRKAPTPIASNTVEW